jgi:hypothetical protein
MAYTKIVIDGKPLGRIRAGWMLFKESFHFLRSDAEMMWIPLITSLISMGLFALLCAISFFGAFGGDFEALKRLGEESSVLMYVFMFCAYVISAFTLALSQAAIVHIVYTRIKGGDATLAQGLSAAFSHWFSLLLWSAITSTVGVILNMIAERSKILMTILVYMLGTAWSVLTYFVVPAMVIDKKTAFESIPHSAFVFKKTWGETLVGNVSLSVVFLLGNLAFLLLTALAVIAAVVLNSIALLVGIGIIFLIGVFVSVLLQSTLNGVIKTLLYVYASEGTIPTSFNKELLDQILVKSPGVSTMPPQSIVGAQ